MSNQSHVARVQANLKRAIASGLLPDPVQTRALQLQERIDKPVRIGLLGKPGSGKSTLLNLLVGAAVLPAGVRVPTMELTYAETAQIICTLADGTKTEIEGADPLLIAELAPVFVEMHMPLPALGKISVLEVVTPDDPTSIHRASQWAAKRCDVVLWCSQSFDANERNIWAQMPDLVKDHAFLMLTKADALRADGTLDTVIAQVTTVARDEFNQILAISTKDAIAARGADGSVDKSRMRESGGMALISAVLKQVELGKQSAVDMADVLLAQHPDALEGPDEPVALTAGPDTTEDEAPTPEAPVVPDEETILQRVKDAVSRPLTATADEYGTLNPANQATYREALDHIIAQSAELVALAKETGEKSPTKIMAQTVAELQWLCDFLNDNGDGADPVLQRARDTAFDAADLVQLMQMEKRDSAAIEAVSLLLQVKHELQADLAA